MPSECPAVCMRGPGTYPSLIAFRSARSSKLPEPTLRTVVKPARRVFRAFATRGHDPVGVDDDDAIGHRRRARAVDQARRAQDDDVGAFRLLELGGGVAGKECERG